MAWGQVEAPLNSSRLIHPAKLTWLNSYCPLAQRYLQADSMINA